MEIITKRISLLEIRINKAKCYLDKDNKHLAYYLFINNKPIIGICYFKSKNILKHIIYKLFNNNNKVIKL